MSYTNHLIKKSNESVLSYFKYNYENLERLVLELGKDNPNLDFILQSNDFMKGLYKKIFSDLTWAISTSSHYATNLRSLISLLLITNEIKRIYALQRKMSLQYMKCPFKRYFKYVIVILNEVLEQFKRINNLFIHFTSDLSNQIKESDEKINDKYVKYIALIAKRLTTLVSSSTQELPGILQHKFQIGLEPEKSLESKDLNDVTRSYVYVIYSLKIAEQIGDLVKNINSELYYIKYNKIPW